MLRVECLSSQSASLEWGFKGVTYTHAFSEYTCRSSHALPCYAAPASLITPHGHLCCGTSRSSTQSLFIFLTYDLWHALCTLRASPGLFPADPYHSILPRHLSPTRKPSLSDTEQPRLPLTLWGTWRWSEGLKKKKISKVSLSVRFNRQLWGGCRLAVWVFSEECTQKKCRTLPDFYF